MISEFGFDLFGLASPDRLCLSAVVPHQPTTEFLPVHANERYCITAPEIAGDPDNSDRKQAIAIFEGYMQMSVLYFSKIGA